MSFDFVICQVVLLLKITSEFGSKHATLFLVSNFSIYFTVYCNSTLKCWIMKLRLERTLQFYLQRTVELNPWQVLGQCKPNKPWPVGQILNLNRDRFLLFQVFFFFLIWVSNVLLPSFDSYPSLSLNLLRRLPWPFLGAEWNLVCLLCCWFMNHDKLCFILNLSY